MEPRCTPAPVALIGACAALLALAWPACAGAAGAADVGVVGPNVLVRPADAPSVSSTASLVAAANEFESVQVVIRAGAGALAGVDVTVDGELTGPSGAVIPASAFTMYRVGYYEVAGLPSDGDLGGALGAFPDSLIPRVDAIWGERRSAFPLTVPAGENRLAWIDVLVPEDAPPGSYEGASIRVVANGAQVGSIPVHIEVLPVSLPSTSSLDGGFDINTNQLCAAHACGSYPGGAAALAAAYARIALDNRLTLAKPPTATPSGPDDVGYRTWSRPLLLGTSPTRLRGARLRTVTIYQWAVESADEWRRVAEADGLLDRIRFHCDEIATSTAAWSRCRDDWTRANHLWRSAATREPVDDLPLQVTTSIDDVSWARAHGFGELVDRIATLIPVINRLHPKSSVSFPGRRAEFDAWTSGVTPGGAARSLWAYTSCMSMGCSPDAPDLEGAWRGWPSYGIDQPAAQARAMGWLAFSYHLAGEYYYETARDLPSAWTTQWSADGGNHGDGTLFYPGTIARVGGSHDTVIESIRLKRIRDGREDHEWLLAAERLAGRDVVASSARALFASASSTDVSQSRIDDARRELAAILAGAPRVVWPPAAQPPREPVDPSPREPREPREPDETTPLPPRVPRALTCAGRAATIVGTPGNDVLRGTPGVDVIVARGGADVIRAGGGADVICVSDGRRDVVSCGAGRDRVIRDRSDAIASGCELQVRTR